MGTASADSIFWGFVHYVKGNRHKTFGNMTSTDFDDMATKFKASNGTEITTAGTGTLTDVEWPTIAGSTVTANQAQTSKDQAAYPETHKGS